MFTVIGIEALRRARPPRAAGHRREGAQTQRRDARPAHSAARADYLAAREGLSNPKIGAQLFISPEQRKKKIATLAQPAAEGQI
jgi:hypothetical protein